MKMYTNSDQTAKLIELGFKKPRIYAGITRWEVYVPICTGSYTLGELIEMLPTSISDNEFNINFADNRWHVYYGWQPVYSDWRIKYECFEAELIDSLFVMCVKLKEEGVI